MQPLIVKPRIEKASGVLVKHTIEKGTRFVFFDSKNTPDLDLYIIERTLNDINEEYAPALPRKHSVDAIMVFTGFNVNLTGLRVKIRIGDEERVEESPVAVFVPKGTLHSYSVLYGSGVYQKIVFAPKGNYNNVTE